MIGQSQVFAVGNQSAPVLFRRRACFVDHRLPLTMSAGKVVAAVMMAPGNNAWAFVGEDDAGILAEAPDDARLPFDATLKARREVQPASTTRDFVPSKSPPSITPSPSTACRMSSAAVVLITCDRPNRQEGHGIKHTAVCVPCAENVTLSPPAPGSGCGPTSLAEDHGFSISASPAAALSP